MYLRTPYQSVDLQVTWSSMWYPVPMAPQEPNLNFLLMMMQMLSQIRRVQPQRISTPNLQQPVELDIQSMILRAQQRNFVMDELMESSVPQETNSLFVPEESDEREIHKVLSSEEAEVQQSNVKASHSVEEKDDLLKRTNEELEDLAAENERINNELKVVKEELKNCRKNKEDEIKCNSIDNLQQLTVQVLADGWRSVALNKSFRPGSKIVIRGRAENGVPRLNFNFKYPEGTALQVDNRWKYWGFENTLILNSFVETSWGQRVTLPTAPIERGKDFVLSVQSEEKEFKICVNGLPFATFPHRVDPGLITTVDISGAAEITSVYYQAVEGQESSKDDEDSSLLELDEWEEYFY